MTYPKLFWCLTMDEYGRVTANVGGKNAYYACDASTLSTWLLAGQRVTCPIGDAVLLDRVRTKITEQRSQDG